VKGKDQLPWRGSGSGEKKGTDRTIVIQSVAIIIVD
jgi:hypothetical protein